MDEIRLINANEIPNFEYTAIQKCGDIETPCKFRIAHWKDIADMPTIDPETLPIVRELRDKLERVTAERNRAVRAVERLIKEDANPCVFCNRIGCGGNGFNPDFCDSFEFRGLGETE